jgi:hypothetical protein
MGAAFAKYNQELAEETEAGGAAGSAMGMNAAGSIPQANERGVFNIPPPPKIIMPDIAPTPGLRGLAPEQTDIQDSFSTTNQYQQRYGIAQQHF